MDLEPIEKLMRRRDLGVPSDPYQRDKLHMELADEVPGLVEEVRRLNIQVDEMREALRWFANALDMRKDKLGRSWSFGYWEGADPGIALVNGGEQGIENSRFNAVLKLASGELGVIMSLAKKRKDEKGVFCLVHKKVMVDGICPRCEQP